jgi:SAM-dependent methyltransferase
MQKAKNNVISKIPVKFTESPEKVITIHNHPVFHFSIQKSKNIDEKTVESFGEEWKKFNRFTEEEIQYIGNEYFDLINEKDLKNSYVLDAGCGSGRWSKYLAGKVKFIEAIDPSIAIYYAAKLLGKEKNIRFTRIDIEHLPFPDNTFDFIISLGVLHHIPNTQKALCQLVKKLKPNGKILIYLYYALDNKNAFYKSIFWLSHLIRKIISQLPIGIKKIICDAIAFTIYLPLKYIAKLTILTFPKKNYHKHIPLYYYHNKTLRVIRNDALDRFGTPLEQRFTQEEIRAMLKHCGLKNIRFSPNEPYWHVIAQK